MIEKLKSGTGPTAIVGAFLLCLPWLLEIANDAFQGTRRKRRAFLAPNDQCNGTQGHIAFPPSASLRPLA